MAEELTPDMVWLACSGCDRQFTLADATDEGNCPRCSSDG